MPRKRQSDMVEGFEVFKALNRAQQEQARRKQSRKEPSPPDDTDDIKPQKVASHIGHTAMPPKHDLVCFECGFHFQITGRIESIACPKCKIEISLRDVTIDTEWSEDIKTGGTITINPTAVVKGSELIAKEIILDGKIEGGSMNAYQRLILKPNGIYNGDLITAHDLIVEPGTKLSLKKTARFYSVDIGGKLSARELLVDALLSIRTGGLFSGKVQALRCEVEEGGGLKAELRVGELQDPETEPPE